MSVCVLCDGRESGDLVDVDRGIERIRYASTLKNDGILKKVGDLQDAGDKVKVHRPCRKNYTSHLKKVSDDKENIVPVKRRSNSGLFDFNLHCLYCGTALQPSFGSKTPKKSLVKICSVTSEDAKAKILEKALAVGGEQGEAVVCRLSGVLDLRAANCRYHLDCYRKFQPVMKTPGRPVNEVSRSAFDTLCEELNANATECQFSVNELTDKLNKIAGKNAYVPRYVKDLLKSRFGEENIVFTDFSGKNSVFCFRDKANKFVYDSWHAERKFSGEDDRTRIIKAAAKIIRDDIRMSAFDNDSYLIGGPLDEDCMVPDSLRLFLSETIKSTTNSKQAYRSREAISQLIVAACRPRSYISPIQIHLSMYVYLNEGSKHLIHLLHSLGLAASYAESRRFIGSLLNSERPEEDLGERYHQWGFDNADYNVRTLDGHKTFHSMGGISCSTPRPAKPLPYTVPRIKGKIVMDVSKGRIPVISYVKPAISSYKYLFATDLGVKRSFPCMKNALAMDALWVASFSVPKELIQGVRLPSWSGYMEVAHEKSGPYDVSAVRHLPFINLDPTNLSCIFTALNFAWEQSQKQKLKTCMTTMDLPLFMKATEIINGCPELKDVVVMLGGFHLIMSFLGCIGEIMSGSGLEELFGTVYAKNSVPHMMSGHAYARSMRAHSLAQQALGTVILKQALTDDNALLSSLVSVHKGIMSKEQSSEDALPLANEIRTIYEDKCTELESTSRTAKLWIEYLKQFELVRLFTRAMRCGDWELYLASMKAMLPYFHAAAHIPYAKAVHIHVQKMESLEKQMDVFEYENFTTRGYFSVRHQDVFFKGVPMDLTIEQKLMRYLKTCGLTRGRGITDSTLAQFVAAFPLCVPLCEVLEDFCGVRSYSSEQHVELRKSWLARDEKDRGTFLQWLEAHPPFEERNEDMLVSLSTGVVADSSINCDTAWEIGFKSMSAMHGQNFADLKLKRKDKIKPLAAMANNIKIADHEVTINPNQLFNRIICMLNMNSGSLADYLEYELSPTAPSLFDKGCLRKNEKAKLGRAVALKCTPDATIPRGTPYVVDGGMLLRAVVWPKLITYGQLSEEYKSHVLRHYGRNAWVIFDGYEDELSTKAAEQLRRCLGKTSPDITISSPDTMVSTLQPNFLGNGTNKTTLIRLLTPVLESAGIKVVQARADADTLIVEKALERASSQTVAVAATDTDILALLIQRAPPRSKIYLHSPGVNGTPTKVYDIPKVQTALAPLMHVMLTIHALTGCDTTSAIFGKGKVGLMGLLENKKELVSLAELFNDPTAKKEAIVEAGEKLMAALYGNQNKTLNELRFTIFHRLVARQKLSADFRLKSLPPTSGAAHQHSLRVYLQVQEWLGKRLNPLEYGWKLHNNRLVPISSEEPPAPQQLLDLIRCGCKKGCARGCECKRSGLPCSVLCSPCEGKDCCNAQQPLMEDEDEDVDDPTASQ